MPERSVCSVLLIGFQDQDNLGLRYLLSSVRHAGFSGRIETYTSDPEPIVELVARLRPDVIGFSLIFQYMSPAFARVIADPSGARVPSPHHRRRALSQLRLSGGAAAHPRRRFNRPLRGRSDPRRADGQAERGEDWRGIAGIAYRRGEEIVANPLRPAIDDLDRLPFPERSDIDYRRQDLSTASVLGSRGCPWNCNFCSIRPFYEAQGGKLRRLRSPAAVVEEMRQLHVEQGARIFLFQDDDFLATGRRAREWAEGIADGHHRGGIGGPDRVQDQLPLRRGPASRRWRAWSRRGSPMFTWGSRTATSRAWST